MYYKLFTASDKLLARITRCYGIEQRTKCINKPDPTDMTIFVEKKLIQLEENTVEQIHCHENLAYVAVVAFRSNGKAEIFAFKNVRRLICGFDTSMRCYFFIYCFLFQDQLLTDAPRTFPSKPLSLAWHPTRADAVVGLKSGEMHSIGWSDGKTSQLPTTNENPILFLFWASANELISLDSV